MIELYEDRDKDGGVLAYEILPQAIALIFKTRPEEKYIYDYDDPGKEIVEQMMKLAKKGVDLTTYKNRFAGGSRNSIALTPKELKELATLLAKKKKKQP